MFKAITNVNIYVWLIEDLLSRYPCAQGPHKARKRIPINASWGILEFKFLDPDFAYRFSRGPQKEIKDKRKSIGGGGGSGTALLGGSGGKPLGSTLCYGPAV